jgi:hypothetical protein
MKEIFIIFIKNGNAAVAFYLYFYGLFLFEVHVIGFIG